MTFAYMPSEIARLVLGYLRETDCKESEKWFIKESKHLTEYALGLRHGISYPTNIGGKSLTHIINGFSGLHNQNNGSNESKTSEELNRLSKQLSKMETNLNKLMESMNKNRSCVQTNGANNYRLIASPSVITTSSPLLIGLNSTPIVSNETPILSGSPVLETPSKCDAISPRRKRLPRRRIGSGSSPVRASANSSCDEASDRTLVNTSSDQLRDESEALLKIDIDEPLVQPEFIVEELINFEPLHDVLAKNINKVFNCFNDENYVQNSEQNIDNNGQNKERVEQTDRPTGSVQEIRINDIDVNNILANLESAPEFNTILDIITEKELQMTPYKNVSSVETTSSSASSLNTPQTPQLRVNAQKKNENCNSVVKNLMPDLKTPEKTITLYAARSPSEATRITPVKVTPVKVFRTNLTPDFNFVLNDKNVPIIVPKVSVAGEDYNLIQNSIAKSLNTYSLSVQTTQTPTKPQFFNSNGTSVRRTNRQKRVNFSKPASELQIKRSDLLHRKILPKPLGKCATTTITQVCVNNSDESVPKEPLVSDNSNNITENDVNTGNTNETQTAEPLEAKDRKTKRPNESPHESSPIKIKASDVRFPTVNILRKMNVNQFLQQIHSNSK